MKLGFAEKSLLAKKAAGLNLDTDRGQEAFCGMAKESGLGGKQLAYYANAYKAAGGSGLMALSYRRRIPEGIRKDAMEKINKYLSQRVPAHLRSQIGFLVKSQGSAITAYEKRISLSGASRIGCIDIFRARYTDFDNRWHLYWMRKFGKWWPYVPRKPVFTIEDCIGEVENDRCGCFWG